MTITPYVPAAWQSSLPGAIWSGAGGYPVLPFLPGQDPTVKKAPSFSTKVKRAASGRTRRNALWPYPIWNFELSYEVIRHKPTNDELAVLWEFFIAAKGQFATWLFVDPTDCQVTAQPFGTGDGVTTTFQLTRPLRSVSEPVFAVYSPTIYVNGSPTAAYTLVPNGAVQFTSAPLGTSV